MNKRVWGMGAKGHWASESIGIRQKRETSSLISNVIVYSGTNMRDLMSASTSAGRGAARPVLYASSATEVAIAEDTSRMRESAGYTRPSARSSSVVIDASVCAARRNITSVTLELSLTSAPNPMPGKMYTLLPCRE